MRASEIAKSLNCAFLGPGDPEIRAVAPMDEAGQGDIAFLHNHAYRRRLASTHADCIVMREEDVPENREFAAIVSDDPHRSMAEAVDLLYPERLPSGLVDSSARIHPTAKVGGGVSIGVFTAVGEGCEIGDGTIIGDNVSIASNVLIGKDCRIYSGVSIYSQTVLGERCIIHSGTVIGSDGFGFAPTRDGILKIRQVGRVVIEDDVEIGANCTIDRGSFNETLIGSGTKIDNLVHVAHNCKIGRFCLIAAQTGLAGSTVLGDRVMVGGQVGFAGHQRVGDGSILFAKSGIAGDVPPGSKLFGIPAKNSIDAHRERVCVSRLEELFKRIKMLEKLVEEK